MAQQLSRLTTLQLTGLTESHLVTIDTLFQSVAVNDGVKDDLVALINAAHQAGFQLEVASGFRSFCRQKQIWNRKFSGQAPLLDSESNPLKFETLSEEALLFTILRWSALPGASRHHWGTDFDIYAKNLLPDNTKLCLEPWEYFNGHQAPFYRWLSENIARFGFFFPYREDRGGVAPEPWHISHRLSSAQYQSDLSGNLIKTTLLQEEIAGLSVVMDNIDIIYSQYIINISD